MTTVTTEQSKKDLISGAGPVSGPDSNDSLIFPVSLVGLQYLLRIALLWLFLALPIFSLYSTERAPWYPRNLELQAQAAFSYQTYHTLNTVHGFVHRPTYNRFLDLSLSGAYTKYAVEIETLLANTRHRSWGFADIALTGRYQWMDDVIGDPYSLTTGLTLTQVFKQ